MALARHLVAIGDRRILLEQPSPIHVGAFLYGYLLVVPGLAWLNDALDREFDGPRQARAWTRAYLELGDEVGLDRVLDTATRLLAETPRTLVNVGSETPPWFVDVVLAAMHSGRPATVLGECTIPWFYNFGLGAHAATSDHFAGLAAERTMQLVSFERWLQEYYDVPDVPWQRILRAFEGPGVDAVLRFASLWEEHRNASAG